MKIAVGGLTACGKTYHAQRIAESFDLKYISGSNLLLALKGFKVDIDWLSDHAAEFLKERQGDFSLDTCVDDKLLHWVRTEDGIVVDSWTLPWLYRGEDMLRIYFDMDLEARASKAFESGKHTPLTFDQIRDRIRQKDEISASLFRTLYGIDIFDKSAFDLIIPPTCIKIEDRIRMIDGAIASLYKLEPFHST